MHSHVLQLDMARGVRSRIEVAPMIALRGAWSWTSLVTACAACNGRKAARTQRPK